MIAAEKIFLRPETVSGAIALAIQHGETAKFIAGGTDLLVNRTQGNDHADCLIDLTGIKELCGIKKDTEFLRIGSLAKLNDLQKHEVITNEFPVLAEAARAVGTPLIRQTATIGGNLLCENRCLFYNQSEWWRESAGYCLKCEGDVCIATGGDKACFSEFVSDTAPALMAMSAQLVWQNAEGEQTVFLKDIYTGDGVKPRKIPPASLLKEILLPAGRKFNCVFKKLRLRESLEFTSLTCVVSVDSEKKIRIALAGVDPGPVYIETDSTEDREKLMKRILKASRAVDNDMFSRKYRREMIRTYIEESYSKLGIA